MGKYVFSSMGLFLFLWVCCDHPGGDQRERETIKKLVLACAHDFETADIAAFIGRSRTDFKFFTLDGRSLNKKQAYEFLQPMFERFQDRKMHIDSLEIFVDRHMAWARYRSTFSFVSSFGPTDLITVNTAIFQRESSGQWKLHHFHMSRK